MRLLVILQCAYYHNGKPRERQIWEKELWKSHTGRRLRTMLPEDQRLSIIVINAASNVGLFSNAVLNPDLTHIANWVGRLQPDAIMACGMIAHAALDALQVSHMAVPHPAWRQLKNSQCDQIKETIQGMVERMHT